MQLHPTRNRHLSVNQGITIGIAGTIIGFLVLLVPAYVGGATLRLFILLASFALLAYFPHCLAHFIVGRSLGLRFSHYELGASGLSRIKSPSIRKLASKFPLLGIRLEAASRREASYRQRLEMFSSGVITSTLLPLIPTTLAYNTIPLPLGATLPLLWLGYLAFGAYFSPKYGDLSRIKSTSTS